MDSDELIVCSEVCIRTQESGNGKNKTTALNIEVFSKCPNI